MQLRRESHDTRHISNTDGGLLRWSLNFSKLINSDPQILGLTIAQAAQYATLHSQFATALAAADPSIRNKGATAAKNDARETLKNEARRLANLIYGTTGVTDSQKITLGLTVRKLRLRLQCRTLRRRLGAVGVGMDSKTGVERYHEQRESRQTNWSSWGIHLQPRGHDATRGAFGLAV